MPTVISLKFERRLFIMIKRCSAGGKICWLKTGLFRLTGWCPGYLVDTQLLSKTAAASTGQDRCKFIRIVYLQAIL